MAATARKRVLKKVTAKKASDSDSASKQSKSEQPAKERKSAKATTANTAAKVSKNSSKKAVPVVEVAAAKSTAAPAAKAKKGVVPVPIFQAPARTKDSARKSGQSQALTGSLEASHRSHFGPRFQSSRGVCRSLAPALRIHRISARGRRCSG